MAIIGSFDRKRFFDELNSTLRLATGYMTPDEQKAKARENLGLSNTLNVPEGSDGQILGNDAGEPEWVDNVGYAEGTWVPYLLIGDGTNADEVYAVQTGTYIRIGNLVVAPFRLQLSSKGTDTGNVLLAGKPFPSIEYGGVAQIGFYNGMALDTAGLFGFISNNNDNVTLRSPTTSGMTGLTDAHFTNTSHIIGTLIYHTPED